MALLTAMWEPPQKEKPISEIYDSVSYSNVELNLTAIYTVFILRSLSWATINDSTIPVHKFSKASLRIDCIVYA
jgi:hypothetical protein